MDSDEDSGNCSDEDIESETEEADQLTWENDTMIPQGWKINTLDVKDGPMKGSRLTRYQSPCGNFFGNLPQVVKFLMVNNNYSESVRTFFKKGITDDGWEKMDDVEGIKGIWYTKIAKGRGLLYLSPKYDVLDTSDIRMYLKEDEENQYGKDTIDAFLAKSNQFIWKADSSLPPNWKTGCTVDTLGQQIKKFLSPSEKVFDNRPEAIKFMIESKAFSNDDITRMQLGMS